MYSTVMKLFEYWVYYTAICVRITDKHKGLRTGISTKGKFYFLFSSEEHKATSWFLLL